MMEGLKGGKSIKALSVINHCFLALIFFFLVIGRDHYHLSCPLLETPVCKTWCGYTVSVVLQRNEDGLPRLALFNFLF